MAHQKNQNSTLGLESKMRNKRLMRQNKRHCVPWSARAVGDESHWPCAIDKRDIAYSDSHGSIVLVHRWLANDRKESEVVIRAIQVNIPVRPLDTWRI